MKLSLGPDQAKYMYVQYCTCVNVYCRYLRCLQCVMIDTLVALSSVLISNGGKLAVSGAKLHFNGSSTLHLPGHGY